MRYNEFKPLNEGTIGDILSYIKRLGLSLVRKIRSGLNKLGFGQTIEVKIINTAPHTVTEAKTKINQARFGYMSEYGTCLSLTELIHNAGLSVTYRQGNGSVANGNEAIDLARSFNDDYANAILSDDATAQDEVDLQIRAGAAMAQAMFDDAIAKTEDLYLLDFEVIHTGESMKFETKADAILRITKKDTSKVLSEIKASLKSYKKWKVNLSNSTVISIFKNLGIRLSEKDRAFLKNGQDIRQTIAGIYRDAVKAVTAGKKYSDVHKTAISKIKALYGQDVLTVGIENLFSEVSVTEGLGLKGGPNYKEAGSALQSAWKEMASEFLADYAAILQREYNADRVNVNEKFLELMGLNGADDFYLAVLDTSKNRATEFVVRSSRTSKEYAMLVEQFTNNLRLEFIHTAGNTASLTINYYTNNNDLMQSTSITVGKSGSMGLAKNNWFFDFAGIK